MAAAREQQIRFATTIILRREINKNMSVPSLVCLIAAVLTTNPFAIQTAKGINVKYPRAAVIIQLGFACVHGKIIVVERHLACLAQISVWTEKEQENTFPANKIPKKYFAKKLPLKKGEFFISVILKRYK